ncbi:amidase [Prauserella shujinwangii]|uniref:Amidase n=1 Tax=Prauserella shujinwangii TaxID=1453103 RepID=A0A2T0LQ99_9PSEU|nr:amidase [Prauserella shujinwangii]PRX45480.1 amidase [Prauserella shujinwangii]
MSDATTAGDLTFAGLTGQADLLARGRVTSARLVEATLARIERSQRTLNAFRHVRAAEARREAEAADRRLAAGDRAPLLGVPVAIKDDTDIAGLPTAFGCAGEFPVRDTDAEVVTRLKRAGAVIVGKTNTPEIGQWPFTEGAAFGLTRNPWHHAHTPGGSSGGSAAAVAAGLVPAALGSDGAGSVRIPAAWNNLVGIKTRRGRIPTDPEPELFHGLTVHGPLARTVADAALLLDVTAGTEDTFAGAARREPGHLRIGLSLRIPFSGVRARLHPVVRAAVTRLARVLTALGHDVRPVEPRYGLIGLDFLPRSLVGVHDWVVAKVPDPSLLDRRTRANERAGARLRPLLRLARRAEPLLHRQVGTVFDEVDVLLAPTTATPPPRADAFTGLPNWRTDRAIVAACPYAWPWNVLGWPAVNVPAGPTADGLPLGAQLLGPADSEELLVSLAAQLERAERWHERTP